MKSLFVWLIALLGPFAPAMEIIGGDNFGNGSEIVLGAPIGVLPSGGFFPLRVEMRNAGAKELKWTILCGSEPSVERDFTMGLPGEEPGEQFTSEFLISCPPRGERVVELLVPIHQRISPWAAMRGLRFFLSTGGRPGQILTFTNEPMIEYHFGMSAEILERYAGDLYDEWTGGSGYYRRAAVLGGAVDVEKLPQDWRAYSGYDSLVLGREDYLSLGVGVRNAIERWVHSGGHLIVLNDGREEEIPGFDEEMISQGFGLKSLLDCGDSYDELQPHEVTRIMKRGPDSMMASASKDYAMKGWELGKELGQRTLGTNLLLIALAVFAIIVGPVNLFVWANKHRRHRLFVTTPVISIVASLLLVVVIMLKDGFGGEGARAVAIEVGGPGDQFSSVIQEQFSRTGILLNSDFSFKSEAVFSAVPAPTTDFNRSGSATSLGLFKGRFQAGDDDWDVEGDFFKSRTEQAQVLTAVRPSRERLELLSMAKGPPRVVSNFSFPLEDVYFRDNGNTIWTAASIAPGATVTLRPSSEAEQAASLLPTIHRFGKSHQRVLEGLTYRPGSFSALGVGAPAIETHSSIDWKETPALVTGRLIQ